MNDIAAFDELVRAADGAAAGYVAAIALPWPTAAHAALFDSAGETLVSTDAIAAGGLGAAVAAVRRFFATAWAPGDVAVTNDQDAGAATACDLTAVTPVYLAGDAEPQFWAAVRAGIPDCGGWEIGGFSPQAVDRWAEGARFEAAKLVAAGRTRREVSDMLMLNSRTPKLTLRSARALAAAAARFAQSAAGTVAPARDAKLANIADALLAPELERIDRAMTRLARRAGKGAAAAKTPFPELALDPVEVSVVPGNDGMTVAIAAPAIAPRPVNLAPGMAMEIVAAAVGAAMDLGSLRTGALRRRLRAEMPSPSLVSAPLPAPVCLGRPTTGAALFAATIAALAEAGIRADGAGLWRSYLAAQGDVALDPATGKIAPARAAAIRKCEAEEAAQ